MKATAEHLAKGQRAELAAEKLLREHHYTIISKNFNCRFGEIDLIALYKNEIIFLEVRYRSSKQFGSAAETVTISKQRKIIKAAQAFLQSQPQHSKKIMRFDVIGFDGSTNIEWLKGAFLGQ